MVVVNVFNHSTWKSKAGGSKLEASLIYRVQYSQDCYTEKTCFNKPNQTKPNQNNNKKELLCMLTCLYAYMLAMEATSPIYISLQIYKRESLLLSKLETSLEKHELEN